jgi:DNA (cytosine-5)-methyltransferase 1
MRPGNRARFERDERHFLYREYLRILAEHAPPVFIMENVKGLLSSTVQNVSMFQQMLADLARPNGSTLRYRIVPLGMISNLFNDNPKDYIVRSELYGVPQTRHRVILCGIRDDLRGNPAPLVEGRLTTLGQVLSDLPAIRSALSREQDSHDAWVGALVEGTRRLKRSGGKKLADVADEMRRYVEDAKRLHSIGKHYLRLRRSKATRSAADLLHSLRDEQADGVTGHYSRAHMRSDLHRYLFAAAFAAVRRRTPKLADFPTFLLPKHKSARLTGKAAFADRFRVQLADQPSTTIVSHICKDGHYFIHPDPSQCRSLTIREAARLQTFPDNYFFEGNRTRQFHQIGNAVPPMLAKKIAASLYNFLCSRKAERPPIKRENFRARLSSIQQPI